MWHKSRKIFIVTGVITLITTMAMMLVSYSKKNNLIYGDQVENYKQGRILEIYTVEDYLEFADSFTEEYNYDEWEIVLCNDLDFSGYENVPVIGDTSVDEEARTFCGTLEGNGYKITNLHISNPGERAAIFACLGGTVKNLRIENCSFEGAICGAVSAENNDARILNCYVDAQVTGEIAGIITGKLWGNIYNCISSGEPVGVIKFGTVNECYRIGTENIHLLNANLYYMSGNYRDCVFNQWKENEDCPLSKEKAN